MSKWILRGCPRCRGDVYVEKDSGDAFERCLQCGYVKQIASRFDGHKGTVSEVNKTLAGTIH